MKQWMIDIIGVGGAVSIVYGAGMLHLAAGFIVGGSLALGVAIIGAKRWAS